jgi:VanZ family protein
MLKIWQQAFKGQLPLWRVFWIGHVLGYFVFSVLSALVAGALDTDIFMKPALLLFIALSVYAIFKCSANVERKFLGKLAKIYAVLWGLTYIAGAITIPIALYL